MSDTKTSTVPALVIRRTFKAPRERVFAAWTQPELIKKWFGPHNFTPAEASVDLRVGGAYRIVMIAPDGDRNIAKGVFNEVLVPERIACSWRWEEDSPEQEHDTLLTVEFHARGNETELVLTHEKLASDESRGRHEHGWNELLDNLPSVL
jgi:uncharacterized protein YndB with AHSA1/START domain